MWEQLTAKGKGVGKGGINYCYKYELVYVNFQGGRGDGRKAQMQML